MLTPGAAAPRPDETEVVPASNETYPRLSSEEQRSLFELYRRGVDSVSGIDPLEARDRLISSVTGSVIALARKFAKIDGGLPIEDYRQEGHLGVLEALADFDPENGAAFSTFAWGRIRGRLSNAHRMHTSRNKGVLSLDESVGEGAETIDSIPSHESGYANVANVLAVKDLKNRLGDDYDLLVAHHVYGHTLYELAENRGCDYFAMQNKMRAVRTRAGKLLSALGHNE